MSFLSGHMSKNQDSVIENKGQNEDWRGKYQYLSHKNNDVNHKYEKSSYHVSGSVLYRLL